MTPTPQKSRYQKVEEFFRPSYHEAAELADALFSPHGEKDASGSRTTEKVKVRIRRKPEGGFRVLLLKIKKPEKKPQTEAKKPVKKQRRHRNDRKGRKSERSS